jgi:predicted transcriptional regulator
MRTSKQRHQFYLPRDLSDRLEALAARRGASKTAIMADALAAWLARRAAHELDDRFGARLDRHSRAAERIERKLDYLTEMNGLAVRHQLTLTAHQPPFDAATRRLGQLRYDEFVRLVGQLAARGGADSEPPTHGRAAVPGGAAGERDEVS